MPPTRPAEVLLTGFEPFGSHAVNPSWEVMKTMDGRAFGRAGLVAAAHLLPVEYDPVREKVPELWAANPNIKLCIHCGVGHAGFLKLEQRARNGTYDKLDNRKTFPESKHCFDDAGDIEYQCTLDLSKVLTAVEEAAPGTKLRISTDAGLYLCEFTYFVSLHKGAAPTVFLHVPSIGAPYTLEELRVKVALVIDALVDVLPSSLPPPLAPTRPRVGMAVLLRHAAHPGCILVGQRLTPHSDGNTTGTGTYAAPGGHLEFGESFEDCARREVLEECGLQLTAVKHGGTVNVVDKAQGYHAVVLIMLADAAEDKADNLEPAKCSGWQWAPWAALPEPIFPSLSEARRAGIDPFVAL